MNAILGSRIPRPGVRRAAQRPARDSARTPRAAGVHDHQPVPAGHGGAQDEQRAGCPVDGVGHAAEQRRVRLRGAGRGQARPPAVRVGERVRRRPARARRRRWSAGRRRGSPVAACPGRDDEADDERDEARRGAERDRDDGRGGVVRGPARHRRPARARSAPRRPVASAAPAARRARSAAGPRRPGRRRWSRFLPQVAEQSASRRVRPRAQRLFTVPVGTPRIRAASAIGHPWISTGRRPRAGRSGASRAPRRRRAAWSRRRTGPARRRARDPVRRRAGSAACGRSTC